MIHPTAVIHPKAQVDATASVGPYAIIDEHVSLGAQCIVGPHVHLTGQTTIGAGNRFHTGCVIGDEPQDLKYRGEPTRVRIGDRNVFREHVTVNRSNKVEEDTVIGSDCLFMASSHVGHNSAVGNHVILANGAALGGHVTVHDRVFISGNCLVHQFCRVGTLAMMQGGSAISADLPPYCIVHRVNELVGLNTVGLRRAGISSADRLEIKRLYHALFRSSTRFAAAIDEAQKIASSAPARTFVDFVAARTKRGFCADMSIRRSNDNDQPAED
ncbi:MAG: acyl-ACP--UDP-N-acetylglucosamine O-acyltransferase [Verrucomicrobia bacterium]|nr:acyl-ACP--UDP-N-acetylglucosamine O-acyltransferase [Verrucomicrobiota bacterium]